MAFFGGLNAERYDRQYSDRQLLGRISGYFRPYRKPLVIVTALVLTIAAAGAATPVLVARLVGQLKPGELLTGQQSSIWLISALVLLAGVLTWGANWLRRRLVQRMVGDIVLALRSDAFRAATSHDLSFYDQFASGKVVSRITSDTQEFGTMVVLVTDLFAQFLQTILLGIVLVSIEWRLSLMLFAVFPVLIGVSLGFRHLARLVTRSGMQAMADVNATIKETVSGIAIAKNFRQETSIFADFDLANQNSYRVNVRRGAVLSLVFPVLNALGGAAMALMVYAGGMSVGQGIVTSGSWFLFIQSLDRFFFPVLNLSAFWAQVQQGLSAAERAFALIDAEPQVRQTAANPVAPLKGDIRFEDVWFRYNDNETVLCDFNLHIQPGETLALVGHTGSGKSSIAKLIARFYEFQRGKLLLDGQDIRTFDLHHYRSQLGIVSQTPFLFDGTVAENIGYAAGSRREAISRQAMEDLAHQIGDGEWLEGLPQGLDTIVGERGSRLSMGQRQLVAFLRVLVHRPAIFILDEATASVDPFTEWQIQQVLNMILASTTSILIAHRLSTVRAVDRIIVLEDGKIIEQGRHEGLLAQGGHYASLYNAYFRHQSLAYVEQARRLAEKPESD